VARGPNEAGKGRRLGERLASRVVARIIDEGGCVTDARILDISLSGARLETLYGASIPSRFTLRALRDGRDHRVEVIWRRGREVGVRFLTNEPLPKARPSTPVPTQPRLSISDLRKLVPKR
jgi:hypothetical protein